MGRKFVVIGQMVRGRYSSGRGQRWRLLPARQNAGAPLEFWVMPLYNVRGSKWGVFLEERGF
jgi:hypothetical protein